MRHYINLYTCIFFPVYDKVGDRHDGSGVSVVYNTVTPMSCDCLKTLVKSCLLSFHPILGCGIAVSSFAEASTVGIFSYV